MVPDEFRKVRTYSLALYFKTLLDFYFDQQSGGIPRILRNLKLLLFFIGCSIDANLVFVSRYSKESDALIEIAVHL